MDPEKKIAVLIPYYQKEAGILQRTVRSVLAQTSYENFEIVVVDDESPVSAEEELGSLGEGRDRITIVRQRNTGPGGARNKALASLPHGTEYVAFMDSDDEVEPFFLRDAAYALDLGYDLFFGNSQRAGIEQTRFQWSGGQASVELNPADHVVLNGERELYAFSGDFFDFVVRRSNIIGPSSMVYRKSIGEGIFYNEAIYNGQDRIFKLHLCRKVRSAAFSPRIYATEGKGINIFDSAGWGSERSLALLSSYIEMCKVILHEIPLNDGQNAFVRDHLARTRETFTASLLHQLRARNPIDWTVVGKTIKQDPGTMMRFVPNALKIAVNRARH